MKQLISAVLLIAFVVSLIAIFFTIRQVDQEEKRLTIDLERRSTFLAESLREAVEPNFINKSNEYLQLIVERYANKERFAGLAVLDNKGHIIAVSSSLPKEISESEKVAADAMDADKANSSFANYNKQKEYLLAIPLHDKKSVVGALMIVQNADYINSQLMDIWRSNLIRMFTQIFLVSLAVILILRWLIYKPIKTMVDYIKLLRSGESNIMFNKPPNFPLFQPLFTEIFGLNKSLIQARFSASEEARLRLEKIDSHWTAERLSEFIKTGLKNRSIYVVSNREPYIHTKKGNSIAYFFPASGMATAIEPIMQACGGTWIAHGSGDADRLVVDSDSSIRVPPNEPKYKLKRVWLTEKEEKGYYYGFSNEGIWPLCHIAHTRPIFRKEDWEIYKRVNKKFADVILKEIKHRKRPIILIQDYHLALLPGLIKSQRSDAVVGIFWHIPWPNSESFSICPFRKELLDGMLGADLISFHTQFHCNNFIDTIGRELESLIDLEQFSVTRKRHTSYIKPFPISIAFPNGLNMNDESSQIGEDIKKDLKIKAKYIGVGVDRLDYTKGIIERFKAVELFLEKNPSFKNNFVFIEVSPISRGVIKRYQEFNDEVTKEVERINNKFKNGDWKPIILLKKRHSHQEVNQFYKLANICLVTSLHDGMNLVAKEFVAARDDEKGVLILSQFAGASRDLKDAFIVNPYNIEQVSEAIKEGLKMPQNEQARKMRKMREGIKDYNVYRWSADILKTIAGLS